MAELKTDIQYIKKSLDTNDAQHKEILGKIDGLAETMTSKIQDKADHKETVTAIKELEDKYVSKESFWPVKTFVYGLIATILTAIVGALLLLVIR